MHASCQQRNDSVKCNPGKNGLVSNADLAGCLAVESFWGARRHLKDGSAEIGVVKSGQVVKGPGNRGLDPCV